MLYALNLQISLFTSTSLTPISSLGGLDILRARDCDIDSKRIRFIAGSERDLDRPLVRLKCAYKKKVIIVKK